MNHNELVGWKYPESLCNNAVAIFLQGSKDHKRNRIRMDINIDIIQKTGAETLRLDGPGRLSAMFKVDEDDFAKMGESAP